MNESDPRVKRTKKILAETLKQLLLEHDSYLDISIKELCEKAELNRRTFYLHYESIDDLLLDIQKEFALNYYDKTKKYDHLVDIEEIMLIFFQMTNDNSIYD